jgi:hypothetical protein
MSCGNKDAQSPKHGLMEGPMFITSSPRSMDWGKGQILLEKAKEGRSEIKSFILINGT